MIREEGRALEEARKLIEHYSQKKHLIKHLDDIEIIIRKIDTPASLQEKRIILAPVMFKDNNKDNKDITKTILYMTIGFLIGAVIGVIIII